MPKGQKTIDWTPANDARLLLTIVAIENIFPDNEKIAAAFGMGVNALAIKSRMAKLRSKAKELGITQNGATDEYKNAGKRGPAVPKNNNNNNKGKQGKHNSATLKNDPTDDESADMKEETDEEQKYTPPATVLAEQQNKASKESKQHQKTIGGRITKARVSPRKSTKKDYKALEDPFEALKDGDGERIFDTDKSDGEDSFASDAEYMKGAQQATIKMEEAI